MDVFDLSAKINLDSSEYEKGLGKAKDGFVAVGKALAVGVAAASAAVGAIVKQSVSAYAEYEQLVGGMETLFGEMSKTGDASAKVIENAANAYKTAGISANDYMSQVTSFSSALMKSLENDGKAAASAADMAITDMADNVNKFGTTMESVQSAYQGFAKQNWTMLDNLSLGYAGTKEGMQQLLEDAGKLSGQKYDISNLNDVFTAIHVIQEEMGVAGTTSREAATTIQGSFSMMKGAWENLVTGMSDKDADISQLVSNFVESVGTVGNNLLPVIETALGGFAEVISQLAPKIAEALPNLVTTVAPSLLGAASKVITTLIQGIITTAPALMQSGVTILLELVQNIITLLPQVLDAGCKIIIELALGIAQALPTLMPTIVDVMLQIVETLIDNIDALIDAAIAIIDALSVGLIDALPILIDKAPTIIEKLLVALLNNVPKLAKASIEIVTQLNTSLFKEIGPLLLSKMPQVIDLIVKALIGAVAAVGKAGYYIVKGLWDGIKDNVGWFMDNITGFGKQIIAKVKEVMKIHSPSRAFYEIGDYMAQGLGLGWEDTYKDVQKDIENGLSFNAKPTFDYDVTGRTGTIEQNVVADISSAMSNIDESIKQAVAEGMSDFKFVFNNRELGRAVRASI